MSNAADIFGSQGYGSGLLPQQDPNEPLILYGPRALFELPIRAATAVGQQIGGAAQMGYDTYFTTPAEQAARAKAAAPKPQVSGGNSFPKNFMDPAYDNVEAQVAQQMGNPTLADALARVRTLGERSNAGAVSSAGANTPYQITPQTRQGIIKQYGFDPWANPLNAAKGAAIALTTYVGKGANFNDQSTQARAFGGYFAGAKGAANPFGSAGDGGNTTGQYVMRTMGQHPGLSAPFVSPFDPHYANMALGQINQAEAASKQPFSISGDAGGPMPEPPKPEPTPKTDFSASDAALEALRPQEVSIKEQNQIKWKNFFAGIGKAMASYQDGEGVGTFFARLGGMALQGKAAASDEIQQKQDDYENRLAKFQAAVYENDFQKAQVQHQELMQDWQANQTWALQKYQQGLAIWQRNATPQIVGNDVVFTKTDPSTGKVSVSGIPINSMVDADFAMKRAQVYGGMFDQQNSANSQVTGIENQIQGQIAMAKAGSVLAGQGSDQEKAAAAAYAPVQAAGFAVDSGQIDRILGPDEASALTDSVKKTLMSRGLYPGTQDYTDGFSKMMTQQLAMAAFADPQLMQKLVALSPAAQLFENYANFQDSKTTSRTTTDSRGRTTRQTTTTGPSSSGTNALDVFAQDIQPDGSQPYAQYGYKRY